MVISQLKIKHDKFCWKCCVENAELKCSACKRSFHVTCANFNKDDSKEENWICDVCIEIDNLFMDGWVDIQISLITMKFSQFNWHIHNIETTITDKMVLKWLKSSWTVCMKILRWVAQINENLKFFFLNGFSIIFYCSTTNWSNRSKIRAMQRIDTKIWLSIQ